MSRSELPLIPNIHIGRVYDPDDPERDLHYETFERLAEFFGRNTPAHRHHSCYQVHFLTQGSIRLHLDERHYEADAPLVFLTPPTIPHAFYTDERTRGHTLTVRQEVVRGWYAAMPGQWPDRLLREPALIQFPAHSAQQAPDAQQLFSVANLLQQEYLRHQPGRDSAILALGELFFIHLSRLLVADVPEAGCRQERSEDVRLFLRYCDLVEARFREHLALTDYARQLNVTEARLNDLCRRMANQSSKELIHDRLVQEARRLLRFSAVPVSEIGYQLGFTDPAYFSRFFARHAGVPPSEFRARQNTVAER